MGGRLITRPLALTAVGDFFVDYVASLTSAEESLSFAGARSSTNIFSSIERLAGGGAAQMGIAAKEIGFEFVSVIGKLGAGMGSEGCPDALDAEAAYLRSLLVSRDIEVLCALDRENTTGRALIIYLPPDRRVLVSDPGANRSLQTEDVTTQMLRSVETASAVHISGYTFLHPGRRAATLELIRAAHGSGAFVALDIVPHDIFRYIDVKELIFPNGNIIDLVIVELGTAKRILDLGYFSGMPDAVAEMVLARLREFFYMAAVYVNPGHAVIASPKGRWEEEYPYVPGPMSRGQSAFAQASLLYKICSEGGGGAWR